MAEPGNTVYFDGRLVPAHEARLAADTRAVRAGLGFFETFRTSGGRPHHWAFHLRRLEDACAVAGLAWPAAFLAADDGLLREVVSMLLEEAGLSEGVFRYTIAAGPENGPPHEILALRPLPPTAESVALRVLRLARDNGEWLPRPKSLNYANALLGDDELRRRGAPAEDEGLFLARESRCVVETPRRNVAWIEGGTLCYPDPALGAVAGTCLAWVCGRGLRAEARRAPLEALLAADAVVVLNAVRGITPVREVWDADDRRRLATLASAAHPLVAELGAAWEAELRATAAS